MTTADRLRRLADALDGLDAALNGDRTTSPPVPPKQADGQPHPVTLMGPDQDDANAAGVKGASHPGVKVTTGNADGLFTTFATRQVTPADLEDALEASREAGGYIRGMEPVKGDDGKPLTALVMIGDEKRTAQFLDKRGPMILVRVAASSEPVAVPALAIHPLVRERVVAVLNKLPQAGDEFNFDPFEGYVDPWRLDADAPAETPAETPANDAVDFARPPL